MKIITISRRNFIKFITLFLISKDLYSSTPNKINNVRNFFDKSLKRYRFVFDSKDKIEYEVYKDKDIIKNAIKISKHVDYLLLDTGSFINKEELGGTGKVHDWNISKIIRNSVKIPVILAGGLNHRNVNKAIEKVMPFGVDVCSGVRTNDKLDLFEFQ